MSTYNLYPAFIPFIPYHLFLAKWQISHINFSYKQHVHDFLQTQFSSYLSRVFFKLVKFVNYFLALDLDILRLYFSSTLCSFSLLSSEIPVIVTLRTFDIF